MDSFKKYTFEVKSIDIDLLKKMNDEIQSKNSKYQYLIYERVPECYLESYSKIMMEAFLFIDGIGSDIKEVFSSPKEIRKRYSKINAQTLSLTVLIVSDNDVIGTINGYGQKQFGVFYIFALYVKKNFEGNRLGTWLTNKIIIEAIEGIENLSSISFETQESNVKTQSIIKKISSK